MFCPPPAAGPGEQMEWIEVAALFSPAATALAKSLLEAEGILYYTAGEGFNQVYPSAAPVRFLVRRDQASAARDLLKGLE